VRGIDVRRHGKVKRVAGVCAAWPKLRVAVVRIPLSIVFPEVFDDLISEGASVLEVLNDLCWSRPELRSRVWRTDGELWVRVTLNGVDVDRLDGLTTTVVGGDELLLFPRGEPSI
jgi:molybdopterin converting factor small subunit